MATKPSLRRPLSGWRDLGRRNVAWAGATAALHSADAADAHVVIAYNLTAQSHTGDSLGDQDVFLGHRHRLGLAIEELHAAGRAAGVAAAGVKLIDSRVFGQCEHQPFSLGHIEFTEAFDSQLGHGTIPYYETQHNESRISTANRCSCGDATGTDEVSMKMRQAKECRQPAKQRLAGCR